MKQGRRGMCSPPESIPLLQMMVKLTQAKKIVEVGVFTGVSPSHHAGHDLWHVSQCSALHVELLDKSHAHPSMTVDLLIRPAHLTVRELP